MLKRIALFFKTASAIGALICIFLPVQAAYSQNSGSVPIDYETFRNTRIVTAVKISESINLDGHVDEPAWKLAIPASDFVQRRPNTGAAAVEQTEVRFIYDDNNLYVGVTCFYSDAGGIVLNDLEEDFNFRSSDIVTVAFDSLHDLRSSFNFSTNVGGAKSDAQTSDGVYNNDWDGVWDVKSSRSAEGWTAEFMIPFKTLRFSTDPMQVWGVNMSRKTLRTNEESDWSPIPIRYNLSRVNMYGTLLGLEGISQGRNLKVTPFVTAGVTQVRPPSTPPVEFATNRDFDGGMDLKYGLNSSLTLDATYRTDFAQVEVDQQQVNLTRFNLLFPEKRDFFLENAGIFRFGAGNNLVPFFSRRIGLSALGTPIPIVGGARITGKINRYDVGFLSMKTERVGEAGQPGYTPSNNYVVGRVKRNLLQNSWVGGLLTSRDSNLNGDSNRVYGTDAHFQFYNRLEFDSHILKSDIPGVSNRNQARQFETGWRDDELTIAAGYNEIQTNFIPDVGFIRRRNNTRYNGQFSWNPIVESSQLLRNLVFGTSTEYFKGGTTGKIETRIERADFGLRFENNALMDFSAIQTFDRLTQPFRIRSDISVLPGDYSYMEYSAGGTSNPGRRISGSGTAEWGEFWDGRRNSFTGNLSWKLNIHLKVDTNYSRNRVRLSNGRFASDLVGVRVSYAFNPRTFFNAFVQYNADTHQVSSNIRFNVIHHPLSDLFLVYNDLRDTTNGQLLQRAVILKLTNLFNF